ncbi:MAG: cobalamin-binding protein [Solirubrobacteraceae bacterium]
MKIVSLVPHATELLFALGLGEEVIGVTHECDHPPQARALPKLTRDALPPGLSAGEIDAAVRERTSSGDPIYELDEELMRELAPELIVTQALCPVCAVSYQEVLAAAERIPSCPRVIALDPHTLGETLGDVRTLAEATGRREAGVALIARSAGRVDRVRLAVRGARRPRVAAIEWLDPPFAAGHWTPQLIELAGGEDVLGLPGEPSRMVSWEEVRAAKPSVAFAMPCGYDAQRSLEEARRFEVELRAIGAQQIVAVDAAGLFSRPGPRLIDGLELLAHVLHPGRVPAPAAQALPLAG